MQGPRTSFGIVEHQAPYKSLQRLIESKQARLAVIGLGYVGLPLAMEFGNAGFRVTGFDVDESRIQSLEEGRSYVTDVDDRAVAHAIRRGNFLPSPDPTKLGDQDAIIICVPTPLRKTKDPDLSFVMAATDAVASHLRGGQLVILESTTYPGTTEELVLPRLKETGLDVGKDFFLAFSPERIDPGNTKFVTRNIPKVVGGATSGCARLAALLYGQFLPEVIQVSSTRVAEMVKLLENTFRSVNIGLVNEMAMMCCQMGIDVWEVIDAAATKPFGFMPFYPGPGLGGHCIPIDPIYLLWKSRLNGFEPRFIELADNVNSNMPHFVIRRAMDLLNSRRKPLAGARVHIMGVTYKPDIRDTRESPALEIIKLLHERQAQVSYTDPYAPEIRIGELDLKSVEPGEKLLAMSDLTIIVTNHSSFDYEHLARHSPLIFDTRNATRGLIVENIIRL